jgi:ELWxxDGT repeat protein
VTLLKEFPPTNATGSPSADISNLAAVGSKLFFVANVGLNQELWVTNGTPAGTKLVKSLGVAIVTQLTAVGSELYFTALAERAHTLQSMLYRSNGTAAGTWVVTMPAGSARSGNSASNLVNYAGALYFAFGDQLMTTSGGAAKVVGNLSSSSSDSLFTGSVGDLTVAGGMLYFTFPDASGEGEDLYATNGMPGGATLLYDFINTSALVNIISIFTPVGSKLFFAVLDAAHGPSLWASDGTPKGTALVKEFFTPSGTDPPIFNATAAGDRLFFTTDPFLPGDPGIELWTSDGTPAGTKALGAINTGNAGPNSAPSQFAALGGTLFFPNTDPAHGTELWRSDGTARGTGRFLDLNPGPAGAFPGNMAVINNTLYFSAATAAGSSALWATNGTAAGTRVVAAFPAQPVASAIFDNIPDAFAVAGNTMIFAADDGLATELWKTDGTPAGTKMIKILVPGPLPSAPSDFTTVGNHVFFDTTEGGIETLWVTDGTAAGTHRVAMLDWPLSNPLAFDGKLAFIETTPDGSVNALWLSDGTARGTTQVTAFPAQTQTFPEPPTMAASNGKLYISAPALPNANPFGFFGVWVSNGTAAGTVPIAAAPTNQNVSALTAYQGKFYFSVDTPSTQVWVTDGTAAGTQKVAEMGTHTLIMRFLAAGPDLYLLTDDTVAGGKPSTSLYKVNSKGTALVHRFANSFEIASAGIPNGNLALDIASLSPQPAGRTGIQLWVSNGTAAGTQMVKGVGGGFGYAVTADGAITPIDGRFFLQGANAQDGMELWQSNGTVAGTTLVQDINPGKGSSTPYALTALYGNLIVAADDSVDGFVLLSLPMPPPSAS